MPKRNVIKIPRAKHAGTHKYPVCYLLHRLRSGRDYLAGNYISYLTERVCESLKAAGQNDSADDFAYKMDKLDGCSLPDIRKAIILVHQYVEVR